MLKVQIIGPKGEGKTTLSLIIEEALRARGINVRNIDPDVTMAQSRPELTGERVTETARKSRASSVTIETGLPTRATHPELSVG